VGVTSEDALAILRVHAYTEGGDLDDLSDRVFHRGLPLDRLQTWRR